MYRKWVFATDLHGDKQDPRAVRGFKKFVDWYEPDIKVFGGDVWDFRAWRKGADEDERRERVKRDFKAGMDFLKWYEPGAITLGNHDARLWDQYEDGVGPAVDLAEDLIGEFDAWRKDAGCRVLPYDKHAILKIGRMKFAHGFFDGLNAARQMASTFGSVMFGHGHAIDVASGPGSERRAARMVGCLCRLRMKYNRRNTAALRQSHGWAYGTLFDDGSYQAFQAELIGDKIVVADRIKVISVN